MKNKINTLQTLENVSLSFILKKMEEMNKTVQHIMTYTPMDLYSTRDGSLIKINSLSGDSNYYEIVFDDSSTLCIGTYSDYSANGKPLNLQEEQISEILDNAKFNVNELNLFIEKVYSKMGKK